MLGLNTFTFLIFIYFFKIFLSLVFYVIAILSGEEKYIKRIYNNIRKDLFFNDYFSMSIEGFIEFIIFGYLNIKTAETSMSGEKLGLGFGVFSLLTSGIVLPITLIILILFTNL